MSPMYSHQDLRPHITGWQERNIAYWDDIAPDYDGLYSSKWSQLENEQVTQEMEWLRELPNCQLLDIGCGTGLGYAICRSLSHTIQYTGLDISPQMIAQCKQRWPSVPFLVGTMSDLTPFESESFDVVLSTLSSFSCSNAPGKTASEIHRVLRPGGRAFVTALNRYSLRRLASLKLT